MGNRAFRGRELHDAEPKGGHGRQRVEHDGGGSVEERSKGHGAHATRRIGSTGLGRAMDAQPGAWGHSSGRLSPAPGPVTASPLAAAPRLWASLHAAGGSVGAAAERRSTM